MSLNVLIVAGGGLQGESLAESIRAMPDARVFVADSIADNLGRSFGDHYVTCPPMADEEAFAASLESLIQDEQIDLVLPSGNIGLKQLASLRPRIEAAGAILGLSDESLLDILLDKQRTYEALLCANIPAQRPVPLTSGVSLPICGKARNGWSGRDMVVLKTRAQLDQIDVSAYAKSHCWVPWLDSFNEFSADFAVDYNAAVSEITVRRRVRTSGGFAVISDSSDDTRVRDVVSRTAAWLADGGGRGIFNVQVLQRDDDLYVSDVNPRHGTSATHARAEGNLLVPFLLGKSAPKFRHRVRSVRTLKQSAMPLHVGRRWRGVVFDLDGTLIDQKHWIMQRLHGLATIYASHIPAEMLLREGYAIVEEGQHEHLIDLLAKRLSLTHERDNLLDVYRQTTPLRARVFPDVLGALRALKKAGVRIGLLTDNPPTSQQAKLNAMGGTEALFDDVVFSRECGAEKPDERGFLAIASKLGLPPDALLMVGDSISRDALGAIASGYDACLLLDRAGGRHRPNEELFSQYLPDVRAKCWIAEDLRSLPMACGIPANRIHDDLFSSSLCVSP